VVGGLLYWGHWLYRMYDQADLHHEEQLRLLEQIAASLNGGANVGSSSPNSRSGQEAPGTYFATSSGTVYHQAGCAVIAHHPTDLRVLGPDGRAGLRPCQICSPA
jgi:hypothetical protein